MCATKAVCVQIFTPSIFTLIFIQFHTRKEFIHSFCGGVKGKDCNGGGVEEWMQKYSLAFATGYVEVVLSV